MSLTPNTSPFFLLQNLDADSQVGWVQVLCRCWLSLVRRLSREEVIYYPNRKSLSSCQAGEDLLGWLNFACISHLVQGQPPYLVNPNLGQGFWKDGKTLEESSYISQGSVTCGSVQWSWSNRYERYPIFSDISNLVRIPWYCRLPSW